MRPVKVKRVKLKEHKMDGKSFPTLYKKNSRGKLQFWRTYVVPHPDHSVAYEIYIEHGQVGGKEQTVVESIFHGKNIGKTNETSVKQQAISEAQSKWNKQVERKGYVQNKEDVDKDLRPGVEPMLAHRYDKYPDKITFPCMVQPKLDGHRCIAVVTEGKCNLFSRQRKPITGLPHIERAVEHLAISQCKTNITFDGELYNHDYKHNFEKLTGFIRSETPKEGCEAVQYHIYDVIVEDVDNLKRTRFLKMLTYDDHIKEVETKHAKSDEEVLKIFKRHLKEGYEGSILRNHEGLYEGKRSYNLQKVKQFEDAEFEIVGVKEGKGKMAGHAVFVCKTSEDKEFKAKMKGPMDKLIEYYKNADNYIGKIITVQFQGLTKDSIPRFPVAIRFKEDV